MFCKNCGKENVSGGDKCEFCGFDFSKPASTKIMDTNSIVNKIKTNKKLTVVLISIAVVLAIIFAFYKIGTELTKPERIIENYITARVNSDFETIYENLDVGDEEFLSYSIFVKCSETDKKAENIKVKSINTTEATEDDLDEDIDPLSDSKVDLAYKVVYTTQTEYKPQKEIVYLTKTGKTFLFFDKYKVNPNKYIMSNYSIGVPSYADVTLDGIKIGENYLTSGSKGYVIPKMFNGTHTLLITSDYTEDYETECAVSKFNTGGLYSLTVKNTLCDEMTEKTKRTIHILFNGAVSKKSFEELEPELDIAKTQKTEIKNFYEEFCDTEWNGYTNEGYVYTKREINEISEDEKECYIAESNDESTGAFKWNLEAPLKFTVDYTVNYECVLKEDKYSFGPHSGKTRFNIELSYTLEDGKLKIYSINNTEVDE